VAVLDDQAERTYVDVASGQLRAERVNDGLGGLARRAVADRDVRSPARGLAIRGVRRGDLMGGQARDTTRRRLRSRITLWRCLARLRLHPECFGLLLRA
jgi:hypothetical protein